MPLFQSTLYTVFRGLLLSNKYSFILSSLIFIWNIFSLFHDCEEIYWNPLQSKSVLDHGPPAASVSSVLDSTITDHIGYYALNYFLELQKITFRANIIFSLTNHFSSLYWTIRVFNELHMNILEHWCYSISIRNRSIIDNRVFHSPWLISLVVPEFC